MKTWCSFLGWLVFRSGVYQPYMPMLAKLFILSSVIHQVCFSLFSSLPYAVGQVRRSSAFPNMPSEAIHSP
jgi:SulP family sulfate permease